MGPTERGPIAVAGSRFWPPTWPCATRVDMGLVRPRCSGAPAFVMPVVVDNEAYTRRVVGDLCLCRLSKFSSMPARSLSEPRGAADAFLCQSQQTTFRALSISLPPVKPAHIVPPTVTCISHVGVTKAGHSRRDLLIALPSSAALAVAHAKHKRIGNAPFHSAGDDDTHSSRRYWR